MLFKILGSVMPMLEIKLSAQEQVYAQTGAMKWMDESIRMDTTMKGGLVGAMKRRMSGEGMFVQTFTGLQNDATVAFGHSYPGNIIPIDVSARAVICQQRAFLCAFAAVRFDLHFTRRLGAGFFGGEGFVLQKVSGPGLAFIEIDGECIEKTLAPGETIRVETGAVGAFEESVKFNITRVKGFRNMLWGGEGLFLTTLTGPGRIWLQTMPIQNMSGEIWQYIPSNKSN